MIFAKEKLITAIDISDGLLKVITVATNKDEKALYVLDSKELPADDKDVEKEIRSLILKNKLTKSQVYVSFPRHLVTVRSVRLPTTNEHEVRDMAELQAINYLPYAREEMVVSYTIIETTKDGYTDILLILTQRKSVDRYVEIFRGAGIPIEMIALSSEGLLNWYLGLKLDDKQPIAIIDIDRYHTHIQIVKNKKMLFSRSVSFDTVNPEQDKDALLGEIKLSFDSFMKEQHESISRIILSGSEDYTSHFSSLLADNISIPCERLEQLRNVKVKDIVNKSLHQLKVASYTYLVGTALESERLTVNLLPRDIIEKKKEETLKSELTKTIVLSLLVIIAIFGIVGKKIHDKRVYIRNIEARLKAIEPEVKRLTTLKENIELIQNQLRFEGSSIDVIRQLYTLLPGDVSLTLFEFEDKMRVLLRGTAGNLSEVFNLLPILEESPYFENVTINYATKRTSKQREFADFEIICNLH